MFCTEINQLNLFFKSDNRSVYTVSYCIFHSESGNSIFSIPPEPERNVEVLHMHLEQTQMMFYFWLPVVYINQSTGTYQGIPVAS